MRRLIVEEWISLDGFCSDQHGRLDFFSGKVRDSYKHTDQVDFLKTIDCILLGRITYTQFVSLWPQRPIENDPLAYSMNNLQKIVFSSELTQAPWGNWSPATVEHNAISCAQALKSQPGKNIIIWGSIAIAQLFMKYQLIDEYRLHVCPALTGGGNRFFTDPIKPETLVLQDVQTRQDGTITLHYIQPA